MMIKTDRSGSSVQTRWLFLKVKVTIATHVQSDLWVLVEQLTHKRGPAPSGGQDQDVRPLLAVIGGGSAVWCGRYHVPEAAVHSADHVAEQR